MRSIVHCVGAWRRVRPVPCAFVVLFDVDVKRVDYEVGNNLVVHVWLAQHETHDSHRKNVERLAWMMRVREVDKGAVLISGAHKELGQQIGAARNEALVQHAASLAHGEVPNRPGRKQAGAGDVHEGHERLADVRGAPDA